MREHIIGDFSSCSFLNEKIVVVKFVCLCVVCLVNIVTAVEGCCCLVTETLAILLLRSATAVFCCFYFSICCDDGVVDELELLFVVMMDDDSNRILRFTTQRSSLFRVQVDGDDQTVQTQDFGENEDQNHTDKQSGLLGGTTDTGVTDNADGETGGQTREADRKTSA